jgi:hypothetical protein
MDFEKWDGGWRLLNVNSPEPVGCRLSDIIIQESSTWTHHWALRAAQSPIYYRLCLVIFLSISQIVLR